MLAEFSHMLSLLCKDIPNQFKTIVTENFQKGNKIVAEKLDELKQCDKIPAFARALLSQTPALLYLSPIINALQVCLDPVGSSMSTCKDVIQTLADSLNVPRDVSEILNILATVLASNHDNFDDVVKVVLEWLRTQSGKETLQVKMSKHDFQLTKATLQEVASKTTLVVAADASKMAAKAAIKSSVDSLVSEPPSNLSLLEHLILLTVACGSGRTQNITNQLTDLLNFLFSKNLATAFKLESDPAKSLVCKYVPSLIQYFSDASQEVLSKTSRADPSAALRSFLTSTLPFPLRSAALLKPVVYIKKSPRVTSFFRCGLVMCACHFFLRVFFFPFV